FLDRFPVLIPRGRRRLPLVSRRAPPDHRAAGSAGMSHPMLAKRVIPCLDVHAGKVTRGQQFGRAEEGGLRDVGDPVELAIRYDADGADELVFYDITASAHGRE